MYPRKRFFDAAVSVMKQANRFVPLFNDKHYSYRWDWAREMVGVARTHRMPLLAGSSVPLAQRRPGLELPRGTRTPEAVSIHGGQLESYGFHGLEVLQSMVEARGEAGETGIARVQVLEGDNAIQKNREVMGATNPADAAPGTVRAEFAESVGENSVHGSDAPETAAVEIAYFFSGLELVG